jgi:hypothetical protein
LSVAQEEALKVFVSATLPPSTRHVGAWIEQEFGLVYQSRSGLFALLQAGFFSTANSGSGSLATFTSRTILPVSSTMQMLVSLTDTSNPAKWSMLRFSF